ncbi:MAG: FkbM family methyltransferase [Crocinitomicaceae bacterium]|nr:FkbM family methyltransferase [Crocinitomicaceae bacterium]
MKESIIKILHYILGYERYLKIFSIFKIRTLSLDGRKSDFLFFNELLNENATIVVIGACTGITTIPLKKGGKNRMVFAYEPLTTNFKVLNRVVNYFNSNNVFTYNLGLGNKQEKREIILPVLNGVKKQGMAHIKDSTISDYNEGLSEIIELDILDNRIEINTIKIDGIKIVAENFEYQIFEGAKKIIENNKPLIYCELWDNEKRNLVLDLIKKYNYNIFFRKGNTLIPYNKNNYSGKNFFFKPENA